MLTFTKDFFLGETRDGFYIEPMMKCAWAAQLEVLAVIEQICNKHGLRYFADWGTLLGAVRHKGFIPWDDDIDICMLREDYDKFFAIAPKELPKEYLILDLNTDVEWLQLFARIVNSNIVSYDKKRLADFHGCPYAVGIDIFPLDELPENPQLESSFTDLFTAVYFPGRDYDVIPSDVEEIIPDLEDLCNIKIDRSKNVQNQLLKTAAMIGKAYQNSGSPFITNMAYHSLRKRFLRKEWYREYVYLPFEQVQLPVPIDYDAVLTEMFGDYMTPVQYSDHEYPFYKKQQESYEQSIAAAISGSN